MMQVTENNMKPEQFIYWLQGFSEGREKAPTQKEWKMVKDHLNTVFTKTTPDYGNLTTVPYVPDTGTWDWKPDPDVTFTC